MPKGSSKHIGFRVHTDACNLCDYSVAKFKDETYQTKILYMHMLKVHGIEEPRQQYGCVKMDANIHNTLTFKQRFEKYT